MIEDVFQMSLDLDLDMMGRRQGDSVSKQTRIDRSAPADIARIEAPLMEAFVRL